MKRKGLIEEFLFVRDLDGSVLFEVFFVSAVLALLGIRFFLYLTGYPQLGGETFHIAHMLWGGLFMTGAVIALLGFVGRSVKFTAAILGGLGFGTFIDELGKFLTRDNDYWFQPSVALIYVLFILLYFIFRYIHKYRVSEREYLVNSLVMMQEALITDLDDEEKVQALHYLEQGNQHTRLGRSLRFFISEAKTEAPGKFSRYRRLRRHGRELYQRIIGIPYLPTLVIVLFVVQSLFNLTRGAVQIPPIFVVLIFFLLLLFARAVNSRRLPSGLEFFRTIFTIAAGAVFFLVARKLLLGVEYPTLLFAEWGKIISSAVAGMLVVAGLYRLPRSRIAAYRLLKLAVLVMIFITQFFAFYSDRFFALSGLIVDIIALIILNYMISQELYLQEVRENERKQRSSYPAPTQV